MLAQGYQILGSVEMTTVKFMDMQNFLISPRSVENKVFENGTFSLPSN